MPQTDHLWLPRARHLGRLCETLGRSSASECRSADGPAAAANHDLSATDLDQLTAIIKNRLKSIQHRPGLIDAFLAQTGLTLDPNRRRPQPFNLCSQIHDRQSI
jgi:hypothetical protein